MDTYYKSIIVGTVVGLLGGAITVIGAFFDLTTFSLAWPVATLCAVVGALSHNVKQSHQFFD